MNELCAVYYRAMPLVQTANVLNSALLAAYFLGSVSVALLGGWLALQATVIMARTGMCLAYRRNPARYSPVRWYRFAVLGSATSGLAWGIAGAAFCSAVQPEPCIVLGFVLGGMGAGALASTASCLAGVQWYLAFSIVPFAIRLATYGTASSQAMAAMCVLYVLFMMVLGRRAHISVRDSLLIRFEHTALIEGLERRIAERTQALQSANQRLSEDIAFRLRSEATLADYASRQAAVASFGQQALSGHAIDTLFDEAASLVAEQLEVTAAQVLECRAHRAGLVIRAHVGGPGSAVSKTSAPGLTDVPAGGPLTAGCGTAAEFALLHNSAIVSDNLEREQRFAVTDELRTQAATGLAAVVIPGRRRPFGVLQVYDGNQRRFSGDDISFLRAIAATLAAAIERKRAEESIQRLALEDSLTGLPNRALFRNQLQQRLAQVGRNGRLLALMLLDLDHFKDINDTLGHPIGDRLLSAVAARLRACGREGEAPARLGGDEFALILPDLADTGDASHIARRIIDTIADPFTIEGHDIRLGVSIGITLCPTDGNDPDTLLRNADLALYRAKAEGRNTYQFYAVHLAAQVEARKTMERDLRLALAGDALNVHYQPQVELNENRIIAAEALLRWQHSSRGPLMPDAFIPVAESSGLVVPLGTWVIARACERITAWRMAGLPPIIVAVNLSPSQCRMPDLVATVERIAEHNGCDLRFLEVEVTEQMFLPHESARSIDCLRRLQQLGVTVSIDDFGTGYSSLGRLQGLPVDKVKIDRCFVGGVGRSRDTELIVGAMITLCRSLGLTVVAEGVETEEQLQFLRASGCHIAQGFYLAPPMPAARLATLLRGTRLLESNTSYREPAHYHASAGSTS